MPRQARKLSKSGIHHIMLRGINKQDIFHDDADMEKILNAIDVSTAISKAHLHAYCLMANHIHLLTQMTYESDCETLSQMMKRIEIRYAMYYNAKYNRVGPLFQERFKSEAVETDSYFLTALRYIHRNPVRAGLVKTPNMYKWSSYNAYITGHPCFVSTDLGKKMLDNRYEEYMNIRDSSVCLDLDNPSSQLTDSELSAKIEAVFHTPAPTIATFGRVARDDALRKIIEIDGVTLRQVSRLTGISRGVVSKVASV